MSRLALCLTLAALVVLAPASARPAAPDSGSIRVGGTPLDLVGTHDSLWVLTCDRRCSGEARRSVGRIVHIDVPSARVVASVPISRPHALAVGPRGIYALDFWRGTVSQLDPHTLRPRATLRLVLPFEVVPGGDDAFLPFDVVVGENAVWVSSGRGALARVDLGVGRLEAMVRLPGKATGELAASRRGVWVAESLLGIYRIDPATNRVSARIKIGPRTRRFAVDRPVVGGGWVLAIGSRTRNDVLTDERGFARIDPTRNRLRSITPLPSGRSRSRSGRVRFGWRGSVDRRSSASRRAQARSAAVFRRMTSGRSRSPTAASGQPVGGGRFASSPRPDSHRPEWSTLPPVKRCRAERAASAVRSRAKGRGLHTPTPGLA